MSRSNMQQIRRTEPMIATFLHNKCAAMGTPLAGNFELTSRCNFNCKMCYVHQQKPVGRELTAEEWLAIGEKARSMGMLFLLLTGGEPLLRPDFREIYSGLKKMGFMISINSNGSLVDDDMLAFLRQDMPCRMNISLYGGSDETYERLCGVPMFHNVTENIRRLRKVGIPVKINAAITPYNADDIEAIYSFGREMDLHVQGTTYMYPPVRINGENYGDAPARFDSDDAARYMLRCREQYMTVEQLCRFAAGSCPDEDDACSKISKGSGMRCRAGKTAFWLTWEGRMLPCGMFPGIGYSVLELGFETAWQAVREETASIQLPGACSTCHSRDRCGACAAACMAETGTFDTVPEYVCRMTKEIERLIFNKYGKGGAMYESEQ